MVARLTARISRAVAVERVKARYPTVGAGACLMCAVLAAPDLAAQRVTQTAQTVTILSRFGTQPGHLLVIPRAHIESVAQLPDALWTLTMAAVLRATRVLEAIYAPARTYVASLGSAAGASPMTCPHVHVHVVAVPAPTLRPADVLSWQHGVLDDTQPAWQAEGVRLRDAFANQVLKEI